MRKKDKKKQSLLSIILTNWSKLLLLAEFAFNNTPSATTGIFLFFTNKEYYMNISLL